MHATSLDLSLPLVLGTAWFTRDEPAAADASISTYLDAGGHVLDTGRIYGDSEDVIGAWLRARGEVPGLQLLTKGSHPDPADWLPRLARDEVLAAVSNYAGLALASAEPDWALEVSLDAATLAWLEEVGIPDLAWSSQSSGFFVGLERGHQFDGVENQRRRATLDEVATLAGVRPEAVLARWTATASPAIVPVLASRSPERLTRTIADTQDASLDAAVDQLVALLDPNGSLGRALIEPGAVW